MMRRVISGVLVVASAGCLVASALGSLGRWHWYADLFTHFRPQLLAASIIMVVLSCIARVRAFRVLSGLALVINASELSSYWVASKGAAIRQSGTLPDSPRLRIATINVLRRNQRYDALIHLLRERRPDVVVLQEMDGDWEQAMRPLKDCYPHQYCVWSKESAFGLGVLSRSPWREARLIELGGTPGSRGLLVVLDFLGRRVEVLNVHAPHPTSREKVELVRQFHDALCRWSAANREVGTPSLVTGDFNLTPWSFLYRRLVRGLGMSDSIRGRIFEATRNVSYPNRLLIDHAFASCEWHMLDRQIGPDIGSDHRPVFLEWALAPESRTDSQ